MTDVKIAIVVAVSSNGVIGRDGGLPWHLPTDLKRFKALTLGKPVIMGRKTWASIGRPLPGRPNIVVTGDRSFVAPGTTVAASLEEALQTARHKAVELGVKELCVIGGGDIYRQAIGTADVLYVTEVAVALDGDTHFPPIDPTFFQKTFEEHLPQGQKDSHAMRFVTWQRKH